MTFDDKTILITGGTGSFGKRFVRRLLDDHTPHKVIVFSRDELKQHEMQRNMGFEDERLRYFIGDIRDKDRLHRALQGVDIVVHAAALKQVPACEYNPIEAVRTNIHGAENIINAALDAGVEKVLALSTDKAVSPVNLYGATKLVMEKLFIQANAYSGDHGTKFSCVRYGNVVGSRGSVVPLFKEQRKTGNITVTDDRMTRFWITLDQGTEFVASCVEKMQGGETFIPKIPSMNIMDLAKAIAPDCEIETIGIRAGEKLHEALIGVDEARNVIDVGDCYIIGSPDVDFAQRGVTGTPVPDGFSYVSDSNDQWLSVEDLKEIAD